MMHDDRIDSLGFAYQGMAWGILEKKLIFWKRLAFFFIGYTIGLIIMQIITHV